MRNRAENNHFCPPVSAVVQASGMPSPFALQGCPVPPVGVAVLGDLEASSAQRTERQQGGCRAILLAIGLAFVLQESSHGAR